jgi:hypothetical protein
MEAIKNAARFSKKFVVNHKVAIAVIGTALVCTQINRAAIKTYDSFLDEKGLRDEFLGSLA